MKTPPMEAWPIFPDKRAKLTATQRQEIAERFADGATATELAAEYGVTVKTIRMYVATRRPGWGHTGR